MSHSLLSRPIKPNSEELNFIYDSWLNSWRTSKWAGVVPNHLYYDTQRALISGLLERGATLRVVTFASAPDMILGWVCYEYKDGATILHYIYSRDPYLAPDLTRFLMDTTIGPVGLLTHQQGNKALRKWKHCPEIARRKSL